jgi:hypothetical protein
MISIRQTRLPVIVATIILLASYAFGFVNTSLPFAAIEYSAADAVTLHGSSEGFSKGLVTQFRDVTSGATTFWMTSKTHTISELRGYGHLGDNTLNQTEANARIDKLEIWGWRDSDGDGEATVNDSRIRGDHTTKWTKLYEIDPDGDDGSIVDGNVVGFAIANPAPTITTSTWQGDVMSAAGSITLSANESWLIIIRVIDASGNSNLSTTFGGGEVWDNGDTSDGIGSDVAIEKYLDSNGNTPGTSDARIQDDDVVWVYVMASNQ